MKNIHRAAVAVLASACALQAQAAGPAPASRPEAAASAAPDLPLRVEHEEERHVIADDGSEAVTLRSLTRVLTPQGVDMARQVKVSRSRSAQALEILEAYTLKADGRRVDVPKTNYQVEVDSGRDGANPAFSDDETTTVVFPDVAVGDAVGFSYRLRTTDPLFPGRLSFMGEYPKVAPYDDVHVVVDAPVGLQATHEAHGMQEKTTVAGGRRVIEWTLQNPHPEKDDGHGPVVWDPAAEPGFAYTTFTSYADIAQHYGARAAPKAAVTERVRKLAGQVTAGAATPREQARALYEWVATHIAYAGNCVGIGAVVPRDLDIVLDNNLGDCKDHATLLQALLAAKGIASHQALVNAGTLYRLPPVPVASLVNHVIDYVPSLDLFLDSTDDGMPFGRLPASDQGKPVLMVDGAGLPDHTPHDGPESDRESSKTRLIVHDDGSLDGEVHVELVGALAVQTRRFVRHASKDDEAQWVKRAVGRMGRDGDGDIVHPPADPLSDRFDYTVHFNVRGALDLPGSGALGIQPVFVPRTIAQVSLQAVAPMPRGDMACTGLQADEDIEVHLPASMHVLSVPPPVVAHTGVVSYDATYALKDGVLHATRHLEDRTPGVLCSSDSMRDYAAALLPVWKDMRQQLLYGPAP